MTAVIAVALAAFGVAVLAQDHAPHRVVFEVTSADPQVWDAVLSNIENVQRALGIDVTEIRVVAHGKGIGLVLRTNTGLADKIAALTTPRVKFGGLRKHHEAPEDPEGGSSAVAGTVDSGVAEVVRLQEAGWSSAVRFDGRACCVAGVDSGGRGDGRMGRHAVDKT